MGADGGRNSPAVNNYGWGKQSAIEDWLFAEGHRFDFFQAVRLLEIIHTLSGERLGGERLVPPGQSADPAKEIVHFRSVVKLDFPSSDVAEVKRSKDLPKREQPKAPAEMSVNFLGLAGCLGALAFASSAQAKRSLKPPAASSAERRNAAVPVSTKSTRVACARRAYFCSNSICAKRATSDRCRV